MIKDFQERLDYLKAIARSDGLAGMADLRSLFSDPLMAKLWMAEDKEGNRFYFWHDVNMQKPAS